MISFHGICGMKWNWLKIYYNSMLKVISWYKIILNLLMEWLMESINEIDFMNEMTFKPLSNTQSNQSFHSALWEWAEWLIDGWVSCLRPQAYWEWKRNENFNLNFFGMNNEARRKVGELSCLSSFLVVGYERRAP